MLAARPAAAERRYNWEIAVADGAAFAALAGGSAMDNDPGAALVVLGGLSYLVGAPILHASHDNTGRAGTSLAVRVLAPLAGGAIGFAIGDDDGEELYRVSGAVTGFAIGMVAASLLDISSPAYDTRDDDDATAVILPVRGGGATVGIAGRF
jgi:hypothetical protein